MKHLLLALLVAPLLPACAELDLADDENLSETEEALTGSGTLSFDVGYGEGYLSPIPDTREGVVDGMVGWKGTQTTISWYGAVWTPAFKARAKNASRAGHVRLDYSGTVPATGSCILTAPSLLVNGSTFVKGQNSFPYLPDTNAHAEVNLTVKTYVGGNLASTKFWYPTLDETGSETRTKAFDKSYSLSNTPSFYAEKGKTVTVAIDLVVRAWSDSEGEAEASIYQFGFLATSSPDLVKIECY